MSDIEPRPFADGLLFGEGMRWYAGRLWLSDMLGRQVLAFDADGGREIVASVPARPNGLGFLPDGRLLITSMADGRLLRREPDGALVEHAALAPPMTGYCGDMAVSARGDAYVDDVGYRVFEGEPSAPGRLLLVRPDGSVSVADEGLQFPNGMWITRDGSELIFAEGRNNRLWSYDIASDGGLTNKRVFAELDQLLDGLTLDEEGAVWQCQPYARRIVRVVRGGAITASIPFGDLKPVACCLGGDDLRTLYVVASDYTLERMAVDDTIARIFTLQVEVPGFPLPGDAGA